ncbi:hypothetical protein, partial [Enterococcus italicus]|uniref:hypothetical protein n=1 Tax=Enterococcus italicus TaxID=246144 RepID=UPI003FA1CE4F
TNTDLNYTQFFSHWKEEGLSPVRICCLFTIQLSALPIVVEKDQKIQKFEKQLLAFLVLYL